MSGIVLCILHTVLFSYQDVTYYSIIAVAFD